MTGMLRIGVDVGGTNTDAALLRASDGSGVMIGTTHFLNAVVEGKRLERVGILRLCGAATRSLPPMIDWPDRLWPLGKRSSLK